MLVLTRKINQQIRLNDDITITVLRAKGNSIRIGIDAPRSVRVVRGELELHVGSEPATEALQLEATDEEASERAADAPSATPVPTEPSVYSMRAAEPLSGPARPSAARPSGVRPTAARPGAPLSAFLRQAAAAPMASLVN